MKGLITECLGGAVKALHLPQWNEWDRCGNTGATLWKLVNDKEHGNVTLKECVLSCLFTIWLPQVSGWPPEGTVLNDPEIVSVDVAIPW